MRRFVAALAAAAVPMCTLSAQNNQTGASRPSSSRGRLPVAGCAGQKITNVVIITQPPYTDKLPPRVEFLREWARAIHANTRDDVIRRYLLLKPGDVCNQIRRAESERILRAQPFLVDARIRVYDDESGGVLLEVETRDEFSLIVEPSVSMVSPMLRGLRVGESNLMGGARLAAVDWRAGLAYNDVFGVEFEDYQFGGWRNELRLMARRLQYGQVMRAEIMRPYYTDLQRWAWIGATDGERNFVSFTRPEEPPNAVNVTRKSAVAGGVGRIGSVRHLRLLGASITQLRQRFDSNTVVIGRDGFEEDDGTPLGVTFPDQDVVRVNALLGYRLLRFVPVQGFDALTGTQDVRVGLQVSAAFGTSIVTASTPDNDHFVAGGLYAGYGGPTSFLATQVQGEARKERNAGVWDNRVMSGRMAWYFRPAVRQLTLMAVEGSSGKDMRRPFQLSFADRDGGLMGYRNSTDAGASRVVFRAEQRMVIPSRLNVADLGIAGFAELGKMWGESTVPYSTETPWRGTVGVSLLGAFPPRSRRMWRLDFAIPTGGDPRSKFELRLTNADRTRGFWTEPRDVTSGRERTVPGSLFNWPVGR
jgi:hypothetical protein